MKGVQARICDMCVKEDGFIIVAVLWILLALALLTSVYSVYVINAAPAAELIGEGLQFDALERSAVEIAAYRAARLGSLPTRVDEFKITLNGGSATVPVLSEAARIDINAAPKVLLISMFRSIGTGEEASLVYADRIIGWRSKAVVTNLLDDSETICIAIQGSYIRRHITPFHRPASWRIFGGFRRR